MKPIVLLLAAGLLHAQSEKLAQVDRLFAEFNNHTPGCAVGVALDGKTVLEAGYGMADLERNIPITPSTVFESGSVAKQFTAGALILLSMQGKISLDDPLQKYLPELQNYGTPVTIRHVLSHVSGLREWRAMATFRGLPEGRLVYNNQDLLEMAAMQRGLNFDPGTHYSYTNTGFNISTILIERALANGKNFQQYTREQIFGPLGMTHSQWRDDYRRVIPNRALAYEPAAGGFIQDTPVEDIIGAGGLLTTVGDLLLWNDNFRTAKVGGSEFVRAQQTPAVLKDGKRISYAAGLSVSKRDGLREVSHSGATGGYRTWLGRYPEKNVSVAVLCNAGSANPVRLGRETARLWTGAIAAPVRPAITVEPEKLSALAGTYRNTLDSSTLDVKWDNGKLKGFGSDLTPIAAGQFAAGERTVIAEAGGRLRLVTDDGDVIFDRVDAWHPTAADLRALAGKYSSSETGATMTVEAKDSSLTMRLPFSKPVDLHPTYRDTFASSNNVFRFRRDADGAITGLSVSDGRTWNLPFERLR